MTPEQITLMGKVREIVEKNPERHDQEVYISAGQTENGSFMPVVFDGVEAEQVRNYALLPIPEESQQEDNVCKTTGCVAGWTAALAAPKGAKLNEWGVQLPGAESRIDSVAYPAFARDALGIGDGASSWLFGPYRSREEVLWALEWLPQQTDTESMSYGDIENAAADAGCESL